MCTCMIRACWHSGRERTGCVCTRRCRRRKSHRWIPERRCSGKSRITKCTGRRSCTDAKRSGRRLRIWRHGSRKSRRKCNCPACGVDTSRRAGTAQCRRRWARESRTARPSNPTGTNKRSWAQRWSTSWRRKCRHFGTEVPVPYGKGWQTDSTRLRTAEGN